MSGWKIAVLGVSTLIACARAASSGSQGVDEAAFPADSATPPVAEPAGWKPRKSIIPPRVAMLAGLLPLRSLGIDTFRWEYPEYDGRGVVIAILDNGVDPNVPGLLETSRGAPKLIDLRDFSGEGRIQLQRLPDTNGDSAIVAGQSITGIGRLRRLSRPPFYAGVFRERDLGSSESADVNGNGESLDEFPVFVVRVGDAWAAISDTDGDRSLEGETVVRDYSVAREILSYRSSPGVAGPSPLSIAVNVAGEGTEPVLDFFFDNSGHGTHVAGIAAGHDLFGVAGFDGVAPGAQVLGLKIADNSRGGISVDGSVLEAMEYAVEFAGRHDSPLVINMSHGIGNEEEGAALIDSLIDEFTYLHPEVLFVVSAGNLGPGISSVGFPGSAEQALSVCAQSPAVFWHSKGSGVQIHSNVVASWSARGGELAKPDLCAPGKAFSVVPPWLTGKEVFEGTSQAAPQIAGVAALLLSSDRARNGAVRAVEVARALKNTAAHPSGTTKLDVGAGIPDVHAAFNWLMAGHQAGIYKVRVLNEGGLSRGVSAAYRRAGFASDADTIDRFVVQSIGGQPAARLVLQPNVDWIAAPEVVEPRGGPVIVELKYDHSRLQSPGLHVGAVTARSATDTAAGPLFELLSTVVNPHGLSPHGYKHKLEPGAAYRHFFDVPEGAGGLDVALGLEDPSTSATLYLFEPDGRPFRGREKRLVGGHRNSEVSITASADEIVPGVYEAVVLAPPAEEVAFWLMVAIPDIVVEGLEDGAVARVRNLGRNRVRVIVSADVIGAASHLSVEGSGAMPESVRLKTPGWADRVQLRVRLPTSTWNNITGFGVTVSDGRGIRVSDGPLIYSGARQVVELGSLEHVGELNVELLPAFAREGAGQSWAAQIEVAYLLPEAQSLALPDGSQRAGVVLQPMATTQVDFDMTQVMLEFPSGVLPLVEVTARLPVGPPSIRRGTVLPERAN